MDHVVAPDMTIHVYVDASAGRLIAVPNATKNKTYFKTV